MKSFPNQIPIFPLSGVIYFPKTNLPLNIFEQRYLDLVNDSIRKDKLIGMIQQKRQDKGLYKVGCLGKISDFRKNKDGRILINLTGITRDCAIKIAQNEFGLKVIERSIRRSELYLADEVFLTGTAAHITPVGSLDNRLIGNGNVGSITKNIREIYLKSIRGDNEDYQEWLTEVKV